MLHILATVNWNKGGECGQLSLSCYQEQKCLAQRSGGGGVLVLEAWWARSIGPGLCVRFDPRAWSAAGLAEGYASCGISVDDRYEPPGEQVPRRLTVAQQSSGALPRDISSFCELLRLLPSFRLSKTE